MICTSILGQGSQTEFILNRRHECEQTVKIIADLDSESWQRRIDL